MRTASRLVAQGSIPVDHFAERHELIAGDLLDRGGVDDTLPRAPVGHEDEMVDVPAEFREAGRERSAGDLVRDGDRPVLVAGLCVQSLRFGGEQRGGNALGLVDSEGVQVPHQREGVVEERDAEPERDDALRAALSDPLLEGDRALELRGHAP